MPNINMGMHGANVQGVKKTKGASNFMLTGIFLFLLGCVLSFSVMFFCKKPQVVLGYVDVNNLIKNCSAKLVVKGKVNENDFAKLERDIKHVLNNMPKNLVLIEKGRVVNRKDIPDYTEVLQRQITKTFLR